MAWNLIAVDFQLRGAPIYKYNCFCGDVVRYNSALSFYNSNDMKPFYLLALQALLVVAKEVASPLTSLDVHTLADNSKEGKFSAQWIWDLDFELNPTADDIQSGDYFTFTVDNRASVPSHDFTVKDQNGNDIMQIKNSGNTFTATYTDSVQGKTDLSGDISFEAPFDKSKLGETAETIIVTVESGSQTLSDTITIDPSIEVSEAHVFGQRKDDMFAWTVRFPQTPWDRIQFTVTIPDGNSAFKSVKDIKDNMVLELLHDVDEFGNPSGVTPINPYENSDYTSVTKADPTSFTGRLFNLPKNHPQGEYNVDMSFVSHIEKIAEVYHLEVEWTLWYHANPNEDTRWTTPGDRTGTAAGAAAYICDACPPEGGGSASVTECKYFEFRHKHVSSSVTNSLNAVVPFTSI